MVKLVKKIYRAILIDGLCDSILFPFSVFVFL